MPPKVKASARIKAQFEPDKTGQTHAINILGKRATSVLGDLQGDHVTAYRLLENGLCRILSGISNSEIEELFKLENRNLFRGKRNKLYDFISAIAVLDATKKDSLYLSIDDVLIKYNNDRAEKTTLREETRALQDDPTLIGKNLSIALGNIEQKYHKNGVLVRKALADIVRLVLTFYNHIPLTSFFSIEGFAASSNEGNVVQAAIPAIETAIGACQRLGDADTLAKRTIKEKHLTHIIKSLSDLIHYPEITDEDLLGEHRAKTLADGAKKTAQARDNTQANLVKILARHLHIAFAVYPELDTLFTRVEIVTPFVEKILSNKEAGKSWPSFSTKPQIASITTEVSNQLTALKALQTENNYTSRPTYEELVSSDDEEEPTKPRVKVKKEKQEAASPETQELLELRKYKQLMDAAIKDGKIKLPKALKVTLEKECPAMFHSKQVGIQK